MRETRWRKVARKERKRKGMEGRVERAHEGGRLIDRVRKWKEERERRKKCSTTHKDQNTVGKDERENHHHHHHAPSKNRTVEGRLIDRMRDCGKTMKRNEKSYTQGPVPPPKKKRYIHLGIIRL